MVPYVAISYHYDSDIDFVRSLSRLLEQEGIASWYLETIVARRRPWQDYVGGRFDWREEPQNWQATFLEHLIGARGALVVLSQDARASLTTEGRGMWREQPAIRFLRNDDARRVMDVERFDLEADDSGRFGVVADRARQILALPPVERTLMDEEVAASFNRPTGMAGPLQMPERKTRPQDWCEIVRLDLYDGQWHCRRCGLRSWNYVLAQEDPPLFCPACGYAGEGASSR